MEMDSLKIKCDELLQSKEYEKIIFFTKDHQLHQVICILFLFHV